MDWLAKHELTILAAEIEADERWIGLKISEIQILRDDLLLFDLNAHITLVKLGKSDKSVDLREAKELAEWELRQCRLQFEFQISIEPTARFSPEQPYQSRGLVASSPFFNALQKIRMEIMSEMGVADRRWLHFSIPGPSKFLILASLSQFDQLACGQWVEADISTASMRSSTSSS